MLREDRELFADLKRVCNDAGPFVLQFLDGDLTPAAEQAYARRLINLGGRLLSHAETRTRLVLDHESPPLILDAEPVLTTTPPPGNFHELTCRTTPRHEP